MDVSATRQLGRSGVKVTIASLGGGSLGNFYRTTTAAEAHAVLEGTWNAGIRYVDTSPFYGRGRSERRLGLFLEDKTRDDYVLSTKVGRLLVPARGNLEQDGIFQDLAPFNPRYDYSYDGVMRSHEASLQRLGIDRVDMLLAHDIGVALHGDNAEAQLRVFRNGGLKALEELRAGGVIRAYGLGVIETEACLDCLDYGDPDAFLLAGRYTLLEQTAALPLLAKCLERGASLIVGGVFNSGILGTGAIAGARYEYGEAPPEILEKVRQLERICGHHRVPLSAAALQFPLAHPAVATVLLGVGTVASLERCLNGLNVQIPPALWEDLVAEGLVAAAAPLPN